MYKPFQPTLLRRVETFHANKNAAIGNKEAELQEKRNKLFDLQQLFKNTEQAYLESFNSKFEKKMDEIRPKIAEAKKEVQVLADQIAVMEKNHFKFKDEDMTELRNEYLNHIKENEPMLKELTKLKEQFQEALVQMVDKQRQNTAASSYTLDKLARELNTSPESRELQKVRRALYPFAHFDHSNFHSYIGEIQRAYSEAIEKLGASVWF